jgi:hypothetical protein
MIKATALVALGLAAGALTACGSSGGDAVASSGDYCGDLKATAAYFKALGGSDAGSTDFSKVEASFATLAKEAPSQLKSDWSQMTNGVSELLDALRQAGLKPTDLESAASLPQDKLKKFEEASKPFQKDSAKISAASDRIEKDAKTRCHVTLSDS